MIQSMSDIKQIERLYTNSYLSLIATLFAAVLVFLLFEPIADKQILTTWFIIFTTVTAVRLFISWRFLNHEHENIDSWLIIFIVASLVSGTMWGLTGFLFIEEGSLPLLDSVLYHGLLLLFITALIAGSIVTYSASRLVYLSFSVPAVVPQCFLLIAQGDKYHSFLGGVVLAYACVMFVISIYIYKIFSENSQIEERNELLEAVLKKNNIKIE
jgi:hypothetical protein